MQANTAQITNLFKKVYGKINDLQPEDYQLQRDIPYSQTEKVGESYSEAVVLTSESGITFGGSGTEAFTINPAIAGAVKQAIIVPSVSIIASVVPWSVMSRSSNSEVAFERATKHVVKNNIKSHGKFLEGVRLYGQATEKLGYVSYATQTYRGVAFTNGTGTLNGIAFTNGINAAGKYILLAPGQFASGLWVGSEGVKVLQIDGSTSAVLAQGKLVSVESELGYIQVDFTPVAPSAASGAGSVVLCWEGMEQNLEAMGVLKILTTQSGNLFGVSTNYSLWHGVVVTLPGTGSKFTFDILQSAVAQLVNRGGLDGDLNVYVNPRTWATLIDTEAGKRMYDESYKPNEATNGFEAIVFHHQAGKAIIQSHRFCKEGQVFMLHIPDWVRSGSAEISFQVPASMGGELIFPLESQAAMAFRSFADQYLFCHAPARSAVVLNVNDEAAS